MSDCFTSMRDLPSYTVLFVAFAATLLVTNDVVRAQDFCAKVDDLIDQSRSGFVQVADKASGKPGTYDATLVLDGASFCAVTRKSNRSWYHCGWEFPYRAQQAYDTFDAFVARVNDCVGQRATLYSDQSVNHPDYYSLRRYEMEQADVSVSVKDKGALGNTFVFIRVQGKSGQ